MGTIFNVLTNEEENRVKVTLIEGRVALYSNDNFTDRPNEILTPSQQAVYSTLTNNIEVASVRTEAVTSWITGVFHFRENTLDEITNELERAFHTKIHIKNDAMKQKSFNATFDNNETLDEILSILQLSAMYRIERIKGEIYIY